MSGRCGGLHCPGCGNGGGGAALVVLAVVVIAAVARPVVHAAITVLEVAAIVATVAAVLAVAAGVAYAAVRARRWHARNRQAISEHARTAQALSAPQRRAIEAPTTRIGSPAASAPERSVNRRKGGRVN